MNGPVLPYQLNTAFSRAIHVPHSKHIDGSDKYPYFCIFYFKLVQYLMKSRNSNRTPTGRDETGQGDRQGYSPSSTIWPIMWILW